MWRLLPFLFASCMAGIFDNCHWGVIELHILCHGEPYMGPLNVKMLDKDQFEDDMMAEVNEELPVGGDGVMFINGTAANEKCDTVQPYLKFSSQCEKDLSYGNYGVIWPLEKARRFVFPKPGFEVCKTLPTKRSQQMVYFVDLGRESYCGLSEL